MGRPSNPLRRFLDAKKIRIVGNTKQYECTLCLAWVSSPSRAITTHYRQFCIIPADKKLVVANLMKQMDSQNTKQSLAPSISPAALNITHTQRICPPSPGTSAALAMDELEISHEPRNKKRKLSRLNNNNSHQTRLDNHFTRNINDLNYQFAMNSLLKWLLALDTRNSNSIDVRFKEFIGFLCPSFIQKFEKSNIDDHTISFASNLKTSIFENLKNKSGLIGAYYHVESHIISFWVLTNDQNHFLQNIDADIFLQIDQSFDNEEKEEQINNNNNNISLKLISEFDCLVSELTKHKFTVLGIKLNIDFIKEDELLNKMVELSKEKCIIIIPNLLTEFTGALDNLCEFEPFKIQTIKLKKLIEYIQNISSLKNKLKYTNNGNESILKQINFVCKMKNKIKNEITNMKYVPVEIANLIFSDTQFWPCMVDLNNVFKKLNNFMHDMSTLSETLSDTFNRLKELESHYKETNFNIYSQQNFLGLRKRIIKSIKYILYIQNDSSADSIFDNSPAMFFLSNFMDPKYNLPARIVEMRASNKLLTMLTPIIHQESFKDHYKNLRLKKGHFHPDVFTSFDELYGTTECNDFAILADSIIHLKSMPLDNILVNLKPKIPNVINVFCYNNLNK